MMMQCPPVPIVTRCYEIHCSTTKKSYKDFASHRFTVDLATWPSQAEPLDSPNHDPSCSHKYWSKRWSLYTVDHSSKYRGATLGLVLLISHTPESLSSSLLILVQKTVLAHSEWLESRWVCVSRVCESYGTS